MKAIAFNSGSSFGPASPRSDSREPLKIFEQLAIPLLNPLYNFAYWLARNRQEAEDLVQETYLKAWQAFSSFQRGTNFRAWMYRILRNTFLTSRTGLPAVTETLDLEKENVSALVATTDTPESILIEAANRDLVRSAIEGLPLDFREVLLLREVDEMSYRDIAATLSLPMGTVMSRLSRARQAVTDKLRKSCAPPVPSRE